MAIEVGDWLLNPSSTALHQVADVYYSYHNDDNLVETIKDQRGFRHATAGLLNLSAMQRLVDAYDKLPPSLKAEIDLQPKKDVKRRKFNLDE